MHLTSVLLLGASPLALTAPVSNPGYTQTKTHNERSNSRREDAGLSVLTGLLGVVLGDPNSLPAGVETVGLREGSKKRDQDIETRQLAGLGALEGFLGPLLGSLDSVAGGAGVAPGVLGGVLKTRDADDIDKRQLEALGALSGLLGPLTGILSTVTGMLKRDDKTLLNNGLETRQPIELDEVTDILGSLRGLLGGVLKRDLKGSLENDEINAQAGTHNLERRQDPIAAIINGILTALAPAIGKITDPISGPFGGKGWNRRVKKDPGLESQTLSTYTLDANDSSTAIVAETTAPLAPVAGGKGYESVVSKRQ